jgi:hypothetical protein
VNESRDFSRRSFLAAGGSLALGALGATAMAKWPTEGLILGSGSHRYQCIHDWLTPPAGLLFGDTHGLAQDSHGRIYLAHTVNEASTSSDAVCVYDEHGKFIRSWGARYRNGAHGLDVRKEGHDEYLYHCDIGSHLVVKTTLDGTVVWEMGAPGPSDKYRSGQPFTPTNVAFSPNGDFYVGDGYGSHWIHRYTADGIYQQTFGGYGKEPGKVIQPHGLWLDSRGSEPLLAVADRGNRRIQYFTLDGKHVRFETEGMRLPCHFSIRGNEMLVPDLDSVITVLDEKNKPIVQLGDGAPSNLRDHPRSDFIPGKFIHPHDAIFLRNGDILVAEWVPIGRVTLLKRV